MSATTIKELCERATPGPWTWHPQEGDFILEERGHIVAEVPCQGANPNDGALIARLSPDVVLKVVEALESINAISTQAQLIEAQDDAMLALQLLNGRPPAKP